MDKCRKCGQEGEIRDLLCHKCTQEVRVARARTEQNNTDESTEEAQVA